MLGTATLNPSINNRAPTVANSKDSSELQHFEPFASIYQAPGIGVADSASPAPNGSCRPKSNKIPACNSSTLSVHTPVRPGTSEIRPLQTVTGSEVATEATVSIRADDRASLYQSLPNGPRTIRTELFAGNRLLESRLDEKATNYRTFQRRGDPRWRTITRIMTKDGTTGEIIRDAQISHKPRSRFRQP